MNKTLDREESHFVSEADRIINRRRDDALEVVIQRAAKAAAAEALRDVGLHDDNAIHDLKELRNLLDSWREVRKSVVHTMVKIITVAVLGALMTGVSVNNWSQ